MSMKEKIFEREELKEKIHALKKEGNKIVFTNGCFDIIHIGHIRYLRAAKAAGDVLVVGVNSDRSVSEIKGPKRPVVPEDERAEVLAVFACVDFITIFDEPDPLVTIKLLMPDVLVKGADWEEDAIVGREVVEENGGRVIRIPMIKGASSTRIIETILTNYRK